MSDINCSACEELRTEAPDFATNGVTTAVCNSLKNDTGLSTSNGHNNATDLEDANDCLIGRMDDELESYDVCDWKDFMHKFIPNLYEFLKAILCSLAGIWTNIHNLWDEIGDIWDKFTEITGDLTKIWCNVNHLKQGAQSYEIHAYQDDDPTKPALNHFRIASGVRMRVGDVDSVPIKAIIVNNVMLWTGSLTFYGNMPSSYTNSASVAWTDFYAGGTQITNATGTSVQGNSQEAGLLVYELQINPKDYGFTEMYKAHLLPSDSGLFTFSIEMFKPGDKYPSDAGVYDANTYNPSDTDLRLIQVRMNHMYSWGYTGSNGKITPYGNVIVNPYAEGWEC